MNYPCTCVFTDTLYRYLSHNFKHFAITDDISSLVGFGCRDVSHGRTSLYIRRVILHFLRYRQRGRH